MLKSQRLASETGALGHVPVLMQRSKSSLSPLCGGRMVNKSVVPSRDDREVLKLRELPPLRAKLIDFLNERRLDNHRRRLREQQRKRAA